MSNRLSINTNLYSKTKKNDVQYFSSIKIKEYIKIIWKKEYPEQDIVNYLLGIEWEEKVVPINAIICNGPIRNRRKALRYLSMLRDGYNPFKPLICINNEVIDGYHRYWAYKKFGFEYVRIYSNVPLINSKTLCNE